MRLALCALREKGILDTVKVSWKRTCLCLPSALKVCKNILYAIAVTASLYGPIIRGFEVDVTSNIKNARTFVGSTSTKDSLTLYLA